VFYIEHPFTWKDYFLERKSAAVRHRKPALLHGEEIYSHPAGFPPHLAAITPPLVVPVNFLPDGRVYRKLSALNNRIVSSTLRKVIEENDIRDFIFINFSDPFYLQRLPADIIPVLYIYQCMDDLSQVAYTNKHGTRLENEVIRQADITLCTST